MKLFEHELRSKDNVNPSLDPLIDLNGRLVTSFFTRLSVGVFQRDKLVIAFLIAFRMMMVEANYEDEHIKFIIKGPFSEKNPHEMTQNERDDKEFKRK